MPKTIAAKDRNRMSLATEAELGSKGRERAQATLAETLPGVRFLVALPL